MRTLRYFTLVFLASACLALAHSAQADATSDAKKAIQAAYDAENAAAAKKDVAKMYAFHSPDFKDIEKGKTLTLADDKRQATQFIGMAKSIKATSSVQKIKLKGKEAVVTVKEHAELVVSVNPQANKTSRMVIDSVSEDTWVKSGKSWLIKLSKSISDRAALDGRPLQAGAEN